MSDNLTLSVDVAIPPSLSPEMVEQFNEQILRPKQEVWRSRSCTSEVKRTETGFTIDVSGPMNAVLDAIASMREAEQIVLGLGKLAEESNANAAKIAAGRARGDLVFVCANGLPELTVDHARIHPRSRNSLRSNESFVPQSSQRCSTTSAPRSSF